jgi:hypothetical protein
MGLGNPKKLKRYISFPFHATLIVGGPCREATLRLEPLLSLFPKNGELFYIPKKGLFSK